MTIKMFIGTSANGEDSDAEMVYEDSLRTHCSVPLDITWMRQTNDKTDFWGGWDTSRWPTPFSGYRWAIPEYCNFRGRAIYTDVDMINFKDINELWNTDLQGNLCAARRGPRFGGHEFCVMLIDCEQMKGAIPPVSRMKHLPESHIRFINYFTGNDDLVTDLDPRWNCLDGDDRDLSDMWILHYTKMETQPWKPNWFKGALGKEHNRPELVKFWFDYRDRLRAEGRHPNVVNNNVNYNIIGK